MAQTKYAQRAIELEEAIVQSFAELDKADGSRIGLQEAIDAAQSILRDAYGIDIDQEVSAYLESEDEDNEYETEDDDE